MTVVQYIKFRNNYNMYMGFKSFINANIVHLVDRSDLFKIINLVWMAGRNVRSLYCSLQGQFMVGIVS